MDISGCPKGFATDGVFRILPAGTCDVPMSAFIAVAVVLCALRGVALVGHFLNWQRRSRHRATSPTPSTMARRKQLPIATLISLLLFICYVLLFLLLGLNIANFQNGGALAIYSVGFLPFATLMTFMLLRVLRLGVSIARFDMLKVSENEILKLKTFGVLGKLLFYLQVLSLGVSSLILIIIGPIIPQHEALLGRIGFGFKASFLASSTVGIVYQLQRVLKVIDETIISMEKSQVQSETFVSFYSEMKQKMRTQQIAVAVIAFPIAILYVLLTVDAIPWLWSIIIPFTMGGETFGALMVALVFNRSRSKTKRGSKNDPATTSGRHGSKSSAQMVVVNIR